MAEIRGPLARCHSLKELSRLLKGVKVGLFEGSKVTIGNYQYTFNQIINKFLHLAKSDAIKIHDELPQLAHDVAEKIAKLNKKTSNKKGLTKKQLYNLKMRQAGKLGMIARKKYQEAERLKELVFKQIAKGADLAYKKKENALNLMDKYLFDKKTPMMFKRHLQKKYLPRIKSLGPKLFKAFAAKKLLVEKKFKQIDKMADKHKKEFVAHVNKTIATQLKYIQKKTKAAAKGSSKKKPLLLPKKPKAWILSLKKNLG